MNQPNPCVEYPQTTLVLDTNIWLDWLVFKDQATARLIAARHAGQVRILAGVTGRGELAEVISRRQFGLNETAQTECMAQFDAATQVVCSADHRMKKTLDSLRCTDPDDQQFVELAVAGRADYLLSKDKALLKLSRRARRDYRLQIMTLAGWNANWSASQSPES